MNLNVEIERQRQLKLRAQASVSVKRPWMNPLFVLILIGAVLSALAYRFGAASQVFTIVSLNCGWLMAYYSANWNSKQNAIVQLRQAACKDVVKKAATVERNLSGLAGSLLALSSHITLTMDKVAGPFMELQLDADKHLSDWGKYTESYIELLYAYSENEILLLPLEPFRVAVYEEQDKLAQAHSDFTNVLLKANFFLKNDQHSKQAKNDILTAIPAIREHLLNQASYLHDFRIELLNHGLGEILGCTVPRRNPPDPRYKTLENLSQQYR